VVSWIDELSLLEGGGVAKAMRVARALKPLRLMKRNQSMRELIDALLVMQPPLPTVAPTHAPTVHPLCADRRPPGDPPRPYRPLPPPAPLAP
jgi:hypothetical protein